MEIDLGYTVTTQAENENELSTRETPDRNSAIVVPKPVSSKPLKIKNFCDSMPKKDVVQTQKLLSKAIHVSGTLLNMTEKPHWQEFFTYLQQAFPSVPIRRQISERFLKDVYAKV